MQLRHLAVSEARRRRVEYTKVERVERDLERFALSGDRPLTGLERDVALELLWRGVEVGDVARQLWLPLVRVRECWDGWLAEQEGVA